MIWYRILRDLDDKSWGHTSQAIIHHPLLILLIRLSHADFSAQVFFVTEATCMLVQCLANLRLDYCNLFLVCFTQHAIRFILQNRSRIELVFNLCKITPLLCYLESPASDSEHCRLLTKAKTDQLPHTCRHLQTCFEPSAIQPSSSPWPTTSQGA